MPQAVLDPPVPADLPPSEPRPSRRPQYVAVVAAVVIGVLLGMLGTARLTPGGSLMVPTAVVLGAGALIVLLAWVVASFAYRTRWLWAFALAVAASTVLAAAWTFLFALPVSLALDSAATNQAHAALARAAARQDAHGTAPPGMCTVHDAGGLGPLAAPYHECTIWSPLAHLVTFEAWGSGRSGGLAYIASVRPDVSTLPDQCVRHLLGSWWMYGEPSNANGDPGQCPIGYRFEGGG